LISSIAGLVTRQAVLANAAFGDEERLSAFGQDQNTLAFLLIMGVVPLLQLISQTHKPLLRYVATALIAVFSFMIASTGSRTGIIVLVLCFVLFIYSAKKIKILVGSIIIAIVGLPILLHFLPESIMDRLFQTQKLANEGDFSGRGVIWSSALKAFSDENFVLGVGYSNFSTMLRQHFGWQFASHNTYLTYLIEFGILGVTTFVYALVKLLQVVKKIYKTENNLFIYCYVMPLFLFMTTLETEYKRWIFMLYVLLFAWNRMKQEEKKRFKCYER
jgi:O-antigen ligase